MIKTIAVLGAGTMGHGIAESFAMYGYPVTLCDIRPEALVEAKQKVRDELTFLAASAMSVVARMRSSVGWIASSWMKSSSARKVSSSRTFCLASTKASGRISQRVTG